MTKKKILIVEDEILVSKDIKSCLVNAGFEIVDVVASGEQAIEVAELHEPDIILMDIKLKGQLSGVEAANLIRDKLDIPIIFLTGFADHQTIDRAKYTEPYGYVIKPFNEAELQTTVEMALYKHEKDVQVKKERDLYHSVIESKASNDSIFIRADYRLNKVKFEDIYYVEALKDYIVINTRENIYTTHASMKDMEYILPVKDFVRVHRSYIVRLDKIYSIKYPDLVIEGRMKVLPVGNQYKKDLFDKLNLI